MELLGAQGMLDGGDLPAEGTIHHFFLSMPSASIAGGSDEEIFAWCQQHGRGLNETDLLVWNNFVGKRGWRDDAQPRLRQRIERRVRKLGVGIEPPHFLGRQHPRQQRRDVAAHQDLLFAESEFVGVQSNTTTPRATSPAIIRLKPSLISSSL